MDFPSEGRDNSCMRQLQFLTTAQLATMRDRTRRRDHSTTAEEFCCEHKRHHAWGLAKRHAEKLRRVRDGTDTPAQHSEHLHTQAASGDRGSVDPLHVR
jgi:hypothetical protein